MPLPRAKRNFSPEFREEAAGPARLGHPPRRREELKQLLTVSFDASDGTYGYRRVHADLAAWGVHCGPELVRALMRELDLQP